MPPPPPPPPTLLLVPLSVPVPVHQDSTPCVQCIHLARGRCPPLPPAPPHQSSTGLPPLRQRHDYPQHIAATAAAPSRPPLPVRVTAPVPAAAIPLRPHCTPA